MKIVSPMSGTLITFSVAVGSSISQGDDVAIIESMKMEIPVSAETDGVVAKLSLAPGDFVEEGQTIIELA